MCPGRVLAMIEGVLSRAERVDALVNAAGIESPRPITIDQATLAEWEKLCAANLTGTFLCCRAVIPAMRRAGGGAIVNIGSELGLVGSPRSAMYGATKGAVIQLTRALAVDPAVLLVDEPTAELDEENRDRAVGLLRDAADRGAAVVVATHDPEVVDLCDRVVRLVDGRPARVAVEDGGAGGTGAGGTRAGGGRAAPDPPGPGAPGPGG